MKFQSHDICIEYPDNIRWKCIRCHMCCANTKERNRHIQLLENEVKRISLFTNLRPRMFCLKTSRLKKYEFEMLKDSSGNCIFLNEDYCKIYQIRPLTCRFYPFFLEQALNGIQKFGLTKEKCPGLKQGPRLDSGFFSELINSTNQQM